MKIEIKRCLLTVVLVCFTLSCGVVQELPEHDNALTTTYTLLQNKINDLDNVALLADGGAPEREIVPSYNQIHRAIKDEFVAGIKHICLLGVLSLDSDINSYPINGINDITLDPNTIVNLGDACGISSLKVNDTITVDVKDYLQADIEPLYDKTIVLDLGMNTNHIYHVKYSNEAIHISMIKKETIESLDDTTSRMIINYDLASKILTAEYMSVLNSSTTQLYFYRTYIDTNNTYLTFFDNKNDHIVFSTTPAKKSYELNTDKKDWEESQYYCVANGGTLASIFSSEENHTLKDVCFSGGSYNDCWIGLNDINQESTLMWANQYSYSGIAYTYELQSLIWNTIFRDCFNLEGTFRNIYIEGDFCDLKKNFICEYNDSDIALSLSSLNPHTNDLNYVNNHCINKTTGIINTDIAYPCGATIDSASDIYTLGKAFLDLPNKTNWSESGNHINFDSSTMGTVPLLR